MRTNGGAVRAALAGLVLAAAPAAAAAQQPAAAAAGQESVAPGIRYGKWAAAALAAGFVAFAVRAHSGADGDFRSLVDYCLQRGSCALSPGGAYADAHAEALYHDVVRGDRTARWLMVGGQAALATSIILFVVELKRDRGTRNIPYAPLIVEAGPLGTRVGLTVPLKR